MKYKTTPDIIGLIANVAVAHLLGCGTEGVAN